MKKRPFSKKQVLTLRRMLQDHPRDLCLLNVALDTCLRSSDLLSLKVETLKSAWGEIRETIQVKMKKTGKMVRCQLSDHTQDSVERWIALTDKQPGDYLFTSIRGGSKPITGIAYRKIVKGWCRECGWDETFFSTHSLRRSLPSIIYKGSKDVRTCQIILGHDSPASTAHYLGLEEEDAFAVANQFRI